MLERGKIIEERNHKRLPNAGGYYSELYNTYFLHQSIEYIEGVRSLRGKKNRNLHLQMQDGAQTYS